MCRPVNVMPNRVEPDRVKFPCGHLAVNIASLEFVQQGETGPIRVDA